MVINHVLPFAPGCSLVHEDDFSLPILGRFRSTRSGCPRRMDSFCEILYKLFQPMYFQGSPHDDQHIRFPRHVLGLNEPDVVAKWMYFIVQHDGWTKGTDFKWPS